MKIKTIFISSGDFGINLLLALLKQDYIGLVAVITQPDKPTGRKKVITPTPVKEFILKNNVSFDILQPEKISKEAKEILEKYQPELIIVASYGQLISDEILNYPKYKCLNFHGSLLPKLRGATPVPMSILQGFTETGVTLQRMVKEMDAGPIIATRTIQLDNKINTEELMGKLSLLSVDILEKDLEKWIKGELSEVTQDDTQATYCYKEDISKEKGEITIDTPIELAERMIRAFYPWPIAWSKLQNGLTFKIYKAEVANHEVNNIEKPELITKNKELYLKLRYGLLKLIEVQLEGKKRDKANNYLYLGK